MLAMSSRLTYATYDLYGNRMFVYLGFENEAVLSAAQIFGLEFELARMRESPKFWVFESRPMKRWVTDIRLMRAWPCHLPDDVVEPELECSSISRTRARLLVQEARLEDHFCCSYCHARATENAPDVDTQFLAHHIRCRSSAPFRYSGRMCHTVCGPRPHWHRSVSALSIL